MKKEEIASKVTQIILVNSEGRELIHSMGAKVTLSYARNFCRETYTSIKVKEIKNYLPD